MELGRVWLSMTQNFYMVQVFPVPVSTALARNEVLAAVCTVWQNIQASSRMVGRYPGLSFLSRVSS